jgi:hypothetical protein
LKNDVTFVAIMIGFFVVAALFVIVCDRIIGSDEEALAASQESETPGPTAGPAPTQPEELAA